MKTTDKLSQEKWTSHGLETLSKTSYALLKVTLKLVVCSGNTTHFTKHQK